MHTQILMQPTVQHSYLCYSGDIANPSKLIMLQQKQLVPGATETSTHSLLNGRGTQQYPVHQAYGRCQLKLASTHTWETSATVREAAHALLGCISLPCVEAASSQSVAATYRVSFPSPG